MKVRDARNAGRDDIAEFFEHSVAQDSERAATCNAFLGEQIASSESGPAAG